MQQPRRGSGLKDRHGRGCGRGQHTDVPSVGCRRVTMALLPVEEPLRRWDRRVRGGSVSHEGNYGVCF
jgi:hypothetical protein